MRRNRVAIQPKTVENTSVEPKSGGSSSSTTYQVKTNGSNLHVRTGPSTSYKIIGKLPNKSTITSSGTEKGWAIHTFNGQKGYSSLQYLTKQNTPTSSTSSAGGKASMKSTLTGTVQLAIPIPNIVANKTVKLEGLGGSLSGNYFVEKVVHTFSSSGYTQDLEVSRKWKGESAKTPSAPPSTSSKPPVQPTVQTKTYTVKKGDCLWNIAKKYYGKGSQYTKIYNANKDKIKNPNLIYPGQVLNIP